MRRTLQLHSAPHLCCSIRLSAVTAMPSYTRRRRRAATPQRATRRGAGRTFGSGGN